MIRTLLMVAALSACAGSLGAQERVYRFQFSPAGAAPADGFTPISDTDRYAPGRPGWLPGGSLASAQRPQGSPLDRSFVYSYTSRGPGDGTFKLDLSDGSYRVVAFCQDLQYVRSETPFDVYANGEKKLSQLRVVGPVLESFSVHVTGGALALRFAPSDVPKRFNFWLINALVIGPQSQGDALEAELAGRVHEVTPLKDFTELAAPQTPQPAVATPRDRARAFQLWCHSYLDLVYPSTLPPAGSGEPALKTFLSPGQTTCVAFSLRALADLGAPAVDAEFLDAPATPLEIKVERVWVRPVRAGSHGTKFIRRPDALLPLADVKLTKFFRVPYAVPADTTQTYWITITAPAAAPAGIYRAAVVVHGPAGGSCRIPLSVAILPLSLPEAPQYSGVYWYRSCMPYPELAAKDLAGMHAHGVRAVAIATPIAVTLLHGKPQVDCRALCEELRLVGQAGLTGAIPYSCGGLISSIAGRKASEPGFDDLYRAVVAEVERQVRRPGMPRILWYPVDEPGNEPARLAAAQRFLAATKGVPGAMTYCTPNSIPVVQALSRVMDVACIQQLSLNAQTIAAVRAGGGTVWFYTSAYDGDRLPDRLRFLNGIFLFKSGAQALFYWHYQCPVGDPLNDLDGATCDYNLCHPSTSGPVPTLGWEAIREGNNDVAFLHALTSWIGRARSSAGAEPIATAQRAQQWLDGLLGSFVLDGARVHKPVSPEIPHERYDSYRFQAADFTMAIMESLGELSPAQKDLAARLRKEFGAIAKTVSP
jgi:hypothetical protein